MHPESPSDLSATATAEAKPRYVYSILKPHGQSFRRQVRLLLNEAKLSYVYSILRLHCQSSRSPVRLPLSEEKPSYEYSILKKHSQISKTQLLPSEAKLNYIYTTLKKHHLPSRSQAVVCVSTPRMYPPSGYFLVRYKNKFPVGIMQLLLTVSTEPDYPIF